MSKELSLNFHQLLTLIATSYGLRVTNLSSDMEKMPDFEDGTFSCFISQKFWNTLPLKCKTRCPEMTILFMGGPITLEYAILPLPSDSSSARKFILLGPYHILFLPKDAICRQADSLPIPPQQKEDWLKKVLTFPVLYDVDQFRRLCGMLLGLLYPDAAHQIRLDFPSTIFTKRETTLPVYNSQEIPPEQTKDLENEMLLSVSLGDSSRAISAWKKLTNISTLFRSASASRLQNSVRVFNILLSRIAMNSGVSISDVHSLCSEYTKQILNIGSFEEADFQMIRMLENYSHLITDHSLAACSPIIRRCVSYINANLDGDLSLPVIAEKMAINPSYLSRLFKSEMDGISLTDFIRRQRIYKARWLLRHSDMKTDDIAEICGINNLSYFRKVFKDETGCTISEYREELLI